VSVGGGEVESGAGDESIEGGGGESLLKTRGIAASGGNAIFQYGFPAKFSIKKQAGNSNFLPETARHTNHCT